MAGTSTDQHMHMIAGALMIRAVLRGSRTMPPRYANRSERISGPIRGFRGWGQKIRCTHDLAPDLRHFSFAPSGLVAFVTPLTQGSRPGLQSVAASRFND